MVQNPPLLSPEQKNRAIDALRAYPQDGILTRPAQLAIDALRDDDLVESNFGLTVDLVSNASVVRTYELRRQELLRKKALGIEESITSLKKSLRDVRIYYFFSESAETILMINDINQTDGCVYISKVT